MKKFNYKILMLAGLLSFSFMSCDDITDVNVDPNNPVEVPASLLNSQAQYILADNLTSRLLNGEWAMLVVQHWGQTEYAEESRYTVTGTTFNLPFTQMYADVLNEVKTAKEILAADDGIEASMKANQMATLDVLEVFTYHTLTDLYGAIPYSQALQPLLHSSPSYDSQAQVYAGIVATLQGAIASMNTSAAGFPSGDNIYNGNMEMWKKFANSLLLRIAMRMSDVDEGTASSVINGISGGFIESNDQNALYMFDGDALVANPLYIDAVINGRDDFAVTTVLVEKLEAMGDPRIGPYASLNTSDAYVGMPPGLTDPEAFALSPTTSRPNPAVRAVDSPCILMDAAEVHFLLAEAYQRGILAGDAAQAYNDGVTASMNFWGLTDTDAIDDYLAANPYVVGTWKQNIGDQKWLAFYMNGVQAWAEWRRLDYPVLEVPAAATNPVVPVRLPYPIDEQTRNAAALGAVTSDPDDLSTKMWWDVN